MPALTSPYSAILFDADRTLWDTMTSEAETIRQITAKWGIPYQEEMPSVYSHINETLWQQIETGAVSPLVCPIGTMASIFAAFPLGFFSGRVECGVSAYFQSAFLSVPPCSGSLPSLGPAREIAVSRHKWHSKSTETASGCFPSYPPA